MKLFSDFEEFIKLLNKYKVKYLIVGGYVVGYYTQPRATGDIDIFIDSSKENAEKILKVLEEFGMESLELTLEDLTIPGQIIQLGNSPVRIDLINEIDGVEFEKAYKSRLTIKFGNINNVSIISLQDLITNKKKSNRLKDKSDLNWLIKSKRK